MLEQVMERLTVPEILQGELVRGLLVKQERDLFYRRRPRERFSTRLYWETQIQRAEHLLAYFEYRQALQRQRRTACSQ